ncbi:MAG: HK97 gp10 family phage protein [Clostridia bacterium]|nr:HK97 gp10 family phage protein [Clostridia bacterium]
MAKFKAELPNDIIKQIEGIEKNTEKMLAEMTEAGASIVLSNIKSNVPNSWYSSNIMKCLKVTRTYKTPSDDGVNTKVAFYGYFINRNNERIPAPLVANVTEYGRSNSPYPKRPFLRRSFKKAQIEKAMQSVQDKYIPKG